MAKPIDARNIVKYIIIKEAKEGKKIATDRLQGILFLIQTMYLYTFLKPCFYNKIYARGFGPSIPDIYTKYEANGIYTETELFDYELDDSRKEIVDEIFELTKAMDTDFLLKILKQSIAFKEAFAPISDKEITLLSFLDSYKQDIELYAHYGLVTTKNDSREDKLKFNLVFS